MAENDDELRKGSIARRVIAGVFQAENSFVEYRKDPAGKARANELRQDVYDKQMSTLLSFETVNLASLVFLASGTCEGVLLLFQVAFTVQAALIIFTVAVYMFSTATHGLGSESFYCLRALILGLFFMQICVLGFAAISIYFASCD
mmetsp:Transcript_8252/g.34656  ORF Transcript_8252/g.34656 Transcript_8252/m.34656 type:complete len:146 (+) Transcript_8252:67-504(+)